MGNMRLNATLILLLATALMLLSGCVREVIVEKEVPNVVMVVVTATPTASPYIEATVEARLAIEATVAAILTSVPTATPYPTTSPETVTYIATPDPAEMESYADTSPPPTFTTKPVQLASDALAITKLGSDSMIDSPGSPEVTCWEFQLTNPHEIPINFWINIDVYQEDGIRRTANKPWVLAMGASGGEGPLLPGETWLDRSCFVDDPSPVARVEVREVQYATGFLYASGNPSFEGPFYLSYWWRDTDQGYQRLEDLPDELRQVIKFYEGPVISSGILDSIEATTACGPGLRGHCLGLSWEISNTSESKTLKITACTSTSLWEKGSPSEAITERECTPPLELKPKTSGKLQEHLSRSSLFRWHIQWLGLWVSEG